ncbi:50S ribosome-binding GTPase [Candidatus Pacearchaeota archaeon]|nr:50S ribosome-binding GTPase [Candidatus Pacearchaeota archaeon]
MLAELKKRLIKFKEKLEQSKKQKKRSGKRGIKKEGLQAVLVGFTQSGKSSIMKLLTNTNPAIDAYNFVTKELLLGALNYEGITMQVIDMPAINSEYCDFGIVNTADTLLIVVSSLREIDEIEKFISKTFGKRIIVFNKADKLTENEKRKIESYLKSRRYNFVIISALTGENINELKEKIVQSYDIIRVYSKEPGKNPSERPFVLPKSSIVMDVAKKIRIPETQIKEILIWGPSSKFPGQKVGLKHELKDKDIVEIRTK